MDKAVIDGIGNVILWLCLAVPAIWIPLRAMAKGPGKENKNQSEEINNEIREERGREVERDTYEDDCLREDKAYLGRIDEHILRQTDQI